MTQNHDSQSAQLPRVAIVTCAVIEDEIKHYVRGLDHVVHLTLLEQGLHNEPRRLRAEVQQAIDHIEATTDAQAIVLGYGLCSRGIEGVVARRCQLVIARAHDCITLLLGSKERYAQYVAEHPGTYWYSPGWNRCHLPPGKERYERLYNQYIQKYGPDNAEYLMKVEQHWFSSYDRAAYVDLTVGATEQDIAFTENCAEWLGWKFDRQRGDPDLLQALLQGRWDHERFLVIDPGRTVRASADERVMEVGDIDVTDPPDA